MKIQVVPAQKGQFKYEMALRIIPRGRGDSLPEFRTILSRAKSLGTKIFEDNRVLVKLPGARQEDIYDAGDYNRARIEWQERRAV